MISRKLPMIYAMVVGASLLLTPGWTGPALEAGMPPLQITIESGSPYYLPVSATAASGTPIRWTNPTGSPHTVTHTECLDETGRCWFESGTILPDGQFTVPSLPPGRYPYFCQLHPIMRGIVIVSEPENGTSQL